MPLRNSLGPQSLVPDGKSDSNRHLWVAWVWHILYILYSLEVGVILLFLPWFPIWDNNYLLYRMPSLRPILASPYLKGAVFGLGIINIIIGIQEIAHFHRNPRHKASG
jgi:hypothetical protein